MAREKKWVIYMHTNLINGKKYVGQTCATLQARFGKNGVRYKRCVLFYNAIQKYGWDNFEHKILEDCIYTQEEANKKEKYYIEKYKSMDRKYGYNLSSGGNEQNSLGIPVFMYNMNGAYVDMYESIADANRDLMISNGKISDCCRGNRKSAGGYMWSYNKEEKLGKYIRGTNSRPVYKYSLTGEFIKKYNTVVDVVNELNINKGGHISSCCNGNRETAYGYQWRYEMYDNIGNAKNIHMQGKGVLQYSLDGVLIKQHDNSVKASEQFGEKKKAAYMSINNCLNKTSKSAYGYYWEYVN